jgi:hypothetical protein
MSTDPDGNLLSLTDASPEPRSDSIIPEIFVHDGPGALAFYRTPMRWSLGPSLPARR